MIKWLNYTVNTGNSVAYPGTYDNLLVVKRNGIGVKDSEAIAAVVTVQGEAFTYQKQSYDPATVPPSSMYLYKITSYISGNDRIERFSIGTDVQPGFTYTMAADGITVSYTTVLGDDLTDVTTALINGVNAAVYPTPSDVAAYLVSPNVIGVTILDTYDVFFTPGLFGDNFYLYQSGRFVRYGGVDYLVSGAESDTSMPSIPAAGDPYDYPDLTNIGSISTYLLATGYTTLSYTETSEGEVDITNFPSNDMIPPDGSTCKVGGGEIQFLEPFIPTEKIFILYKE